MLYPIMDSAAHTQPLENLGRGTPYNVKPSLIQLGTPNSPLCNGTQSDQTQRRPPQSERSKTVKSYQQNGIAPKLKTEETPKKWKTIKKRTPCLNVKWMRSPPRDSTTHAGLITASSPQTPSGGGDSIF